MHLTPHQGRSLCYGRWMPRPDLNLLVALDVLLAEGNVTRAARRLRLSPSAMSRTLARRSEEHTSELQSQSNLVCRLLLEKKKIAVIIDDRSVTPLLRTLRPPTTT